MIKTTIIIFLVLFMPFFINGANAGESDFPVLAREATTFGLEAAKKKDWDTAIEYFKEAQRLAPAQPEVLLNLALANDKVPGRELAAFTWYKAYLAVSPRAKNVPKVKKRVIELESEIRANLKKIVEMIRTTLPEVYIGPQDYYSWAHYEISQILAELGDINGAMEEAEKYFDLAEYERNAAWSYRRIAQKLTQMGELDEAIKVADIAATKQKGDKKKKEEARLEVLQAIRDSVVALDKDYIVITFENDMAEIKKDIFALQRIAEEIGTKHPKEQGGIYGYLISKQAFAGDINAAEETLSLIKDNSNRFYAYIILASARDRAEDPEGTSEYLKKAVKYAEKVKGTDYEKANIYSYLASIQLKLGDPSGAMESIKTAKRYAKKVEGFSKSFVYKSIVQNLIDAGEWEEAEKVAQLVKDDGYNSPGATIANNKVYKYVDEGNIDAALETVKKNPEYYKYGTPYSFAVFLQIEKGNVENARAIVPYIKNDSRKWEAYSRIARAEKKPGEGEMYELLLLVSDTYGNTDNIFNMTATIGSLKGKEALETIKNLSENALRTAEYLNKVNKYIQTNE